MQHWLVKSEPNTYSWDDLVRDGQTYWDGVRNYQARNNLRAMSVGDPVLYYHSQEGLAVVGVAQVTREAYQDPSTNDERWSAVNIEPVDKLAQPVSLHDIKQDKRLQNMALVKHSRLSVMPVAKKDFDIIVQLGRSK